MTGAADPATPLYVSALHRFDQLLDVLAAPARQDQDVVAARHDDQILDVDGGHAHPVGADQAVLGVDRQHFAAMRIAEAVELADRMERVQLPTSFQPMATGTTATRSARSITA